MILFVLLGNTLQTPDKFIAPIERMSDLKAEIIYADRNNPYFLEIENGVFYIGHPEDEGGVAGEDVAYTWGRIEDCSTSGLSCKQAGAHVFVRSVNGRGPLSYSNETSVTAWRTNEGGWWGAGTWCGSHSNGVRNSQSQPGWPSLSYQYEVNATGVVTRILVAYRQGNGANAVVHELKLETKKGIQL